MLKQDDTMEMAVYRVLVLVLVLILVYWKLVIIKIAVSSQSGSGSGANLELRLSSQVAYTGAGVFYLFYGSWLKDEMVL